MHRGKEVEKLHRENQLVHHDREILIASNSKGIFTDFRKITVLQYPTTQPLKKKVPRNLGKLLVIKAEDLLEA